MDGKVFTQIILSVIAIIGTLVSYYVIPYVKTLLTDQQLSQVINYVDIAVRCAEQIYSVDEWKKKKSYVLNTTKEFLTHLDISVTDEQLNTMIEAMVHEVKKDRETITADPRLYEELR